MKGKTDKQFLFDVQLNWLADKKGILTTNDAAGAIHVATPVEFGGTERCWSPEHLFLGSISSCFMTTYLAFAQKLNFGISHFTCNGIGQIEIVEGKYKFTHIHLYPKIYIADDAIRAKAAMAMEKTHKYCLISNSVNAAVYYHSEILRDPHPKIEQQGEEPVTVDKDVYALETDQRA